MASNLLLVHEWLASVGGSESVFDKLIESLSPVTALCLWNDVPQDFPHAVRETLLGQTPLRGRKALSLPIMPWVWRQTDFSSVDTVVASSHVFAHHVASAASRQGKRAFAYVHTPARYIWAPEVEARGRTHAARLASPFFKRMDRNWTDPRVSYAANSAYIKSRIEASWGREARVIYPPVAVRRIQSVLHWSDHLDLQEQKMLDVLPRGPFVLGASRLVSYKRLDQVIALGARLDLPVVIAGSGPDERALRAAAADATVPVVFVGRVSDSQLYALYQLAALFVFPAIEDFGIMPVEAMAAGGRVLVNTVGGAAESVAALGRGGVANFSDLSDAAKVARQVMAATFASGVRANADFSEEAFTKSIKAWVTP